MTVRTAPDTNAGRGRSALDYVAMLAAAASTLAALWLVSVVALVLPGRDPGGIPFWTGVAVLLLACAALTAPALRPGRRSRAMRAVLGGAGMVAVGLGASLVATELGATAHFEGYILLIGLVLAGQGTALLLTGFRRAG